METQIGERDFTGRTSALLPGRDRRPSHAHWNHKRHLCVNRILRAQRRRLSPCLSSAGRTFKDKRGNELWATRHITLAPRCFHDTQRGLWESCTDAAHNNLHFLLNSGIV
ncbi:hypothetical protein EYF80_008861 [Liparis tanakae]|uniref:Uncharacterized protein n=1 Tax=Liparis tanakae TaxID=230148 RepID=A0A4Z2ISM7_9TELE|nr:hypothetical protein EYF80_008861 [Liparis tanakae]